MSVCSLALVIWKANRIFSAQHYIVVCGLCSRTISFSALSHKTARPPGKSC